MTIAELLKPKHHIGCAAIMLLGKAIKQKDGRRKASSGSTHASVYSSSGVRE